MIILHWIYTVHYAVIGIVNTLERGGEKLEYTKRI